MKTAVPPAPTLPGLPHPTPTVTEAPDGRARAPNLLPLSSCARAFREAETARTLAWRALERGDRVGAVEFCQQAAAAFTRAAALAAGGRPPCQ